MKKIILVFVSVFSLSLSARGDKTADPCSEVSSWRLEVCRFAEANLKHSAWGFEHGKQDYLLAKDLAEADRHSVDDEVLFAAALLHDMGAFSPYEQEGVDHAVRSAQVVASVLEPAGFPMDKLERVQKAILAHNYYGNVVPETNEALVLHDADALNFLGALGAARLLSVVGVEAFAPNVKSVVDYLRTFEQTMETRLYGGVYSKAEGARRAQWLRQFLDTLGKESYAILGAD
ncbi:MAG: HD domain-containing protein [Bdellovibrionales bacterium]|nr:HD domain-containing protein [Bdellovibrionales bacterium]